MDDLGGRPKEPVADLATGSVRRTPTRLLVFISATFLAGLVCLAVTVAHQGPADGWSGVGVQCYVLALFLLVGELWPIPVPRGDDRTDLLTTSSTFATALVLIGPLGLGLVAQAVAVAVDDRVNRRPLRTVSFNIGQYLLTLTATRAVFATVAHHDVFALTTSFTAADIPGALVAGATYFVVNNGLVAVVVALATGLPLREVLGDDVRFQLATSSILLGLAPVAAHAASLSVFMLGLLLLPLLGVLSNARTTLNRHHESLHDPLTGLANREFFRRRAERALLTATATGRQAAVLLIDLDHFKEINDTLGHQAGDDVIREVAARLGAGVSGEVSVARLGGDEFAVIVPDTVDQAWLRALAASLSERLRPPIDVGGARLVVRASIGIALAPAHADSVSGLLKCADLALYHAKGNRGDIRIFSRNDDPDTHDRVELLADLGSALAGDQLVVDYQPQLSGLTGEPIGVEALCRWQHPVRGLVGPDTFIPLAESSNVIGPLTRWVLENAVASLARWREQGHDLTVSVNVSARALTDVDLPDHVAATLSRHGVAPAQLVIEVTEHAIAADTARTTEVLARLRALGVRLSIDDYGTGSSSLAVLQGLAVDELKVDRTFVLRMVADERAAIIVRSTIELAHGLGLVVTAEGVQDGETMAALRALGCDGMQGFHCGRPMRSLALDGWLAGRRSALTV